MWAVGKERIVKYRWICVYTHVIAKCRKQSGDEEFLELYE